MKTTRKKERAIAGTYPLSAGISLQLSASIHDLEKEEWASVIPAGNFFLQPAFLQTFEDTAPDNMAFHYAMIYRNNEPLAAFYFQVIHLTSEEIGHILKPLSGELRAPRITAHWGEWLKRTKEEKGFRMLICGNNFISGEYGVGMKAGSDPAEVYTALAETVKVIMKNDREPSKLSSILVKDYFSSGTELPPDQLKKKRYHRFRVEPEMIVSLQEDWKTFGDYLAAMSKKYRSRAKGVLKDSAALEAFEMDEKMIEAHHEELYALYHNLHLRAKFRLAPLGNNYFCSMKRSFPETFRVTGYRLNGKLVAFRSSFLTNDHLEAHFIGIDYSHNAELRIYQRILYDFVQEGIDSGRKKIYLGRTASEMKTTVGAVAHDLVCYIRHRNGLSNQVIRPFIDYLQPSAWVPHNPFKD